MENLYFCQGCTYFTEHKANGYIGVCGANPHELPTAEKTSCTEFHALENDQDYAPPRLVVLPAIPQPIQPITNFATEGIITNLISERRCHIIEINDLDLDPE
jgi:hypothetical protein